MSVGIDMKYANMGGGGLGSLLKIGLGAMTGGLGGAALGAVSGSNTPIGRAAGMYGAVNSAANAFGGGDQPYQGSISAEDSAQPWAGMGGGYGQYDGGLQAMQRRMMSKVNSSGGGY